MWVDQLDIRPSEHWDRAIERAVARVSRARRHSFAPLGRFR